MKQAPDSLSMLLIIDSSVVSSASKDILSVSVSTYGQTHRQTHVYIQTDRQTDRQAGRQAVS